MSRKPSGSTLSPAEQGALLAAYGVAAVQNLPATGQFVAAATVTAWQDPLFGPLVSCARGIDRGHGTVVLAPVGVRDATLTAAGALGEGPGPAAAQLADVLTRVAALVDDFAQVTALRLTCGRMRAKRRMFRPTRSRWPPARVPTRISDACGGRPSSRAPRAEARRGGVAWRAPRIFRNLPATQCARLHTVGSWRMCTCTSQVGAGVRGWVP